MVEGGGDRERRGGEGFSCCQVSFCSNSNCNCYDCHAEEEGHVKREREGEEGEACSAWAAQIFNLYFVFMLILHFPQFSHPQKAPLSSSPPLVRYYPAGTVKPFQLQLSPSLPPFALQFLATPWTLSGCTGSVALLGWLSATWGRQRGRGRGEEGYTVRSACNCTCRVCAVCVSVWVWVLAHYSFLFILCCAC